MFLAELLTESREKEKESSQQAATLKQELEAATSSKEAAEKLKEQLDAAVAAKETADADGKLLAQRLSSVGTSLLGK